MGNHISIFKKIQKVTENTLFIGFFDRGDHFLKVKKLENEFLARFDTINQVYISYTG